MLLPITHTPPSGDTVGIEIPAKVKAAIGLDDVPSWVIVSEHNVDEWGTAKELARDFARELVKRYGVVADVAIHEPGREGDNRNHHAHILTTTRTAGAEGL
ncbi:MobA/MobL family protein [Gluconacetobacter dulcium]|uniref:MobA/MobL family protein n=1 Tax=Gluconacetobacter dulcium TaxID=2729096 RepID=UPI0035C83FA6